MKYFLLFIAAFLSFNAFSQGCEAYFTLEYGDDGLVVFDNQSVWEGEMVTFNWQFGDAGSSDGSNPEFMFEPGEYVVCLTISTNLCEDDFCETVIIPDCAGVTVSLESIIDPGTLIELAWLLENELGESLDEGLLELILGGANGELGFCLEDGCYTLTLTGPEEFSFDILLFLLDLEGVEIVPFDVILEGNFLSIEFGINSDCSESDCPAELWAGPAELCGCYVFEVGSFVEGESVIWDFGDGTMEEGGHFADHCYEMNGSYTVTAEYSSPTCPQETYQVEVNIDCFDNCTLDVEIDQGECGLYVFHAFDFPEGALIEWFVDSESEVYQSGTNPVTVLFEESGWHYVCAAYETPDCPQGVWWCAEFEVDACEEDCPTGFGYVAQDDCGCFGMEIGSFAEGENVIWDFGDWTVEEGGHYIEHCYAENGIYAVIAEYSSNSCPGEVYAFEVVVDCYTECTLDVEIAQAPDCGGQFVLEAYNYSEDATLVWTVNGDIVDDDNLLQIMLEEPASYQICVAYETPDCPEGVNWCETFIVEDCTDCPEAWNYTVAEDCMTYTFYWNYIPNGEEFTETTYAFGDGTFDVTYELSSTHTYTEPGEYVVSSTFTSESCSPGLVVSEQIIVVEDCNTDCSIEVTLAQQDCGWVLLEAFGYPENADIWWEVDDLVTEEGGNVFDWEFMEAGWHTICVAYELEGCGLVYDCVEFEVPPCLDFCPEDIYMAETEECGCYVFEIGSFVEGEEVLWDFGDGTTLEGGHFAEHCYQEDGEYIVTAWYTSSQCEGTLYTLGVAEVNCNGECSDVLFQLQGGMTMNSPEVLDWLLYDENGNVVMDGTCDLYPDPVCQIDACLEDGCYQMEVWGNGALTPGNFEVQAYIGFETLELNQVQYWPELYMSFWFGINSECEPGCEETNIAFDSFMNAGGPAYVEWEVDNMDGFNMGSGICQFGMNDPYCDVNLCLQDGCYTVNIWSETPIDNPEAFTSSVSGYPIVDGPYFDGEYHMWYVFSLNGDCVEDPCSLEIDLVEYECGWYLFEAFDFPDDVTVWWEVDDEWLGESGSAFDYNFSEGGVHWVCAMYESPDCPQGIWSCMEFVVELCEDDCPDYFEISPQDDCGCFEFWVNQPGQVVWYVNDTVIGDGIEETHCFEENGLYVVVAAFFSDTCPEGVELVQTVEVECEGCTPVGFAFDSFTQGGGPEFIEWELSNDEGVISSGGCEYNNQTSYCDADACLEDGCYTMTIYSSSENLDSDAFFSAAFMNGEQIDYADEPELNESGNLVYTFGVNSECETDIDETLDQLINVYPVPAISEIYIEMPAQLLGAQLHIVDMKGALVLTQRIADTREVISANEFADGLYTLMIVTENQVVNKKIQVIK